MQINTGVHNKITESNSSNEYDKLLQQITAALKLRPSQSKPCDRKHLWSVSEYSDMSYKIYNIYTCISKLFSQNGRSFEACKQSD